MMSLFGGLKNERFLEFVVANTTWKKDENKRKKKAEVVGERRAHGRSTQNVLKSTPQEHPPHFGAICRSEGKLHSFKTNQSPFELSRL
jgi:hypothetical protein